MSHEDRAIHDRMIVLDGCCPLLAWGIDPMSGKVDDATIGKGAALYIEGGVTAAGASVGGTRTNLALTRTSLTLHNKMVEDQKEYGHPPYVYPTGLETPATFYNITNGLLSRGYSEDDTQKVMGGNWMRVMKDVWGE